MTQIFLDANLAERLQKLHESVEFCDPSGKVIGNFQPTIDLAELERAWPELSKEEIQRRLSEKRYSTAEVLTHLEKL